MTLDINTIALMVLVPCLGFFLKHLHGDIRRMQEEIKTLQVHLPTNYVQKGELKDLFERIYAELVEIKQELRSKEDKQ